MIVVIFIVGVLACLSPAWALAWLAEVRHED
jgi:hypothetical protein